VAAVKQSRKIASQDISVNHMDEMANRVGLFFGGLFQFGTTPEVVKVNTQSTSLNMSCQWKLTHASPL